MSTIFARPESALKRAEELIHVGQKQAALQALHDLITSKRCRSWQKPLEKVMMRYVELCVDLRKGRFAKDGLIQYSRIVCQQQLNNVSSLEEVVKHFMHLSSKKAEEAAMNQQAQALDVHDLEAPEDLMLSYVGGKDRPDTPWLKFLWETYRTVLEVLRNNSKLEALYAMAAHKAFQFCKQYKRSTEFRRLCEMIRNHLVNLNRSYRDRPDLTAPESCQLYLDTRVEQLKVAAELSLSQEAFRSVEDVHGLMSMVQRTPKPSVLAVYYAKLTEIFWTSESHYLYHAYAWLELFNLHKSHNKNLTRKDLQLLASSALLAALSVTPYYDHKSGVSHLGLENEKERSSRMANLLNFSFDSKRENREKVSRTSLLSELAARGVVSCASQEVQDLYNLTEHEFHPLDLASKVQPLLSKISTIGGKLSAAPLVPEIQLSQYQPALEKLTTLRVLQQASRVFHSMRIDTLSRMIPFFDFNVVEKIAVDAVKHSFIAMKVDHLSGAVRFGNTETESDVPGATHLIGVLADSLNKVSSLVHPPVHEPYKLCEDSISLAGVVEKEHQRLLARKSFIEKRKEDDERQILEKEKAEEAKRLSIQKKSADEERERLLKERRLREQQRIRQEIEDRKQREIENSRQKVTKQGAMEFVSRHLGYRMSRQGMEKRLEKLAKRMDHLERARRQEEAPLIEEAFRKLVEEEKLLHEQEQLREIELSEQRHAGDLLEKKSLSRLLEHKNAFQERIVQRREAEFLSLTKEREERINQLISSRRRERETARKLTYYLKMEEERIQRAREEEEERIQRVREEEEQRIQRAREEEEQREEEERKRREGAPPARSNQPWRRRSGPPANSSSSGSWRH